MGSLRGVKGEIGSQSKEDYTGYHAPITLDFTSHNKGDSAQGGFRMDSFAQAFSVEHPCAPCERLWF